MGALHQGHQSLVQRACQENQKTVVSIFINPTQFDDQSDFENYPHTLDSDFRRLEDWGVSYVFVPPYTDIYPDNYQYKIAESVISQRLCGKSRPGHFTGMLTVVLKLLAIIQADKAYFGEKDYQQYELVSQMTKAFFVPTTIVPCPTMREKNGLAISSRNQRLSPAGMTIAPIFYALLASTATDNQIKDQLISQGFKVDYIETYNKRRYGAVFLEGVRLIDNIAIDDDGQGQP